MHEARPGASSYQRPAGVASAEESEQDSRRILERVARESDTLGASALVRAARDAGRGLAGNEDDAADGVEIWAKRIGRSLGLLFAVYLLAHLLRQVAGL